MGFSGLGATRLAALTEAPSTLIVLMVMGSPWSGSRSRITRSASLPGSRVPLPFSSNYR
jgi:hypothetical protein